MIQAGPTTSPGTPVASPVVLILDLNIRNSIITASKGLNTKYEWSQIHFFITGGASDAFEKYPIHKGNFIFNGRGFHNYWLQREAFHL